MDDPANAWLDKVEKYDREEQTYTGAPTPEDEGHSPGKKKPARKRGRPVHDFNPYHEPAGSPEGGRFTSGQAAEGLKKNPEK